MSSVLSAQPKVEPQPSQPPEPSPGVDADQLAAVAEIAAEVVGLQGGHRLPETVEIVIGVDTHEQFHVAAVVDARTGGQLGAITVPTHAAGLGELVEFADEFGRLRAWAIEGTSSHGRGLTHRLGDDDELVYELDRPGRQPRRRGEKSDHLDAVRAAREVLARPRLTAPKTGGVRSAIAVLTAARNTAIGHATDAERQLRDFARVTGPATVQTKLEEHATMHQLVTAAAKLRVTPAMRAAIEHPEHITGDGDDIEVAFFTTTLRDLARRVQYLRGQARQHELAITRLIRTWRPDLLDLFGVGPLVAAVVLTAWSHPGRVHSRSAFAMLAGAAPLQASSGTVQNRHRLNRSGNRRLNQALHTIVLSRQRSDPDTKAYTLRRTAEGKNPREIRRCLKNYIARQLFKALEHPVDKT